ncbi:MAG: asparagine synthase (glutamine-hydrolyzing) [Flavobacteriaceae bacterium]|jgi:asparagine synthase (glutamine-hydrolysing)|nr:asparagine synthase (glutamine-hydrolyzing) [Flavobacteriaceae bacterium]
MCGINGLVSNKKDILETQSSLKLMNKEIFHRGPDEEVFFVETSENRTSVGMSVLKFSATNFPPEKQPISSEDKNRIITLDGRIYNSSKLKNEFLSGENLSTETDAEIILKLYEKFGTSAFGMLDGIFTLGIFDKTKNKIYIARDFFGGKPLYYFHNEDGLIWASELKSIMVNFSEKPRISMEALNLFLQLTYIPAPFSIYENIFKLETDHYLEYDVKDNKIFNHPIFRETPPLEKKSNIGFEEAKKQTRKLIEESVKSRSFPHVSCGSFLSGGVDSSVITLCLSKIKEQKIDTFFVGFNKKSFDESHKSRVVAKLVNSNHHEFVLSEKELEDSTDKIILNFDEPFADSSALPTYFAALKTRAFVKTALSGEGGDEVFGGYNKYLIGSINRRYTRFVPEKIHGFIVRKSNKLLVQKEDHRGFKFKLKKTINSVNYTGDFYYNIIKLGFKDHDLSKILLANNRVEDALKYYKNQIGKPKNLTDFREIDRKISLEGDMMVKADRTTMLASLGTESPFLNKKIWDFASTLPEKYLLNGNNKKYILKKAFEDYFPKNFLNKNKQGFGVPVGDWLRSDLKEELLSYIDAKKLEEQNLFDVQEINKLVINHIKGIEDNSFTVWTFYCFQKWYFRTYLNL